MNRIGWALLSICMPVFASAQCLCPPATEGLSPEKPLASIVARYGASPVLICGYLEKRVGANEILASEFDAADCRSGKVLLSFDALETCDIKIIDTNMMVITLLERLPMGANWEWIDVPRKEYRVVARANSKHEVTETYVLKLPVYSSSEIDGVLSEYNEAVRQVQAPGAKQLENSNTEQQWFDFIETLLGKLALTAMTGNAEAVKAFRACSSTLAIDGHFAEEYEQYERLLEEHAKKRQA